MQDRDLFRDLSRMIHGELSSAEAKRLAKSEGFESFAELCETRLPEDLAKVRLSTRDLLGRIDRFRRRATDIYELWFWADQVHSISFNHRIAYEPRSEDLIQASLAALSVVGNEKLFPNRQKTVRAIEYVRACLLRRKRLRMRNIFLRLFEDLDSANLANKSPIDVEADDGATLRWAEVVLLDRPFRPESDVQADYDWVTAFTVTTKEVLERERAEEAEEDAAIERSMDAAEASAAAEAAAMTPPPDGESGAAPGAPAPAPAETAAPPPPPDAAPRERREPRPPRDQEPSAERDPSQPFEFRVPGWREKEEPDDGDGHGSGEDALVRPPHLRPPPREDGEEIDRIPALMRLVPNFGFERYKPRYLHDGDGIAEIVLDAPAIGRAELRYAAKLFCLANRIRQCRLDGETVKTLVVKPGAGRRADKP